MGNDNGKLVSVKENFALNLCESLNKMQRDSEFCDLILTSASRKDFAVHRVVLAVAFPKLRKYLTGGTTLLVTAYSDAVLLALLNLCYNGELTLGDCTLKTISALMNLMHHEDVAKLFTRDVQEFFIKGFKKHETI